MREALVSCVVFVLVASIRFLSLTGFPDDHYVHLAGAQQLLHGEWPSRDFVDLGAPLTYAVSAAAQAIFGQRQLTEALLMAVAFGVGALLTLRAGVMLTGSVVFGLAPVLIEVLVFPRSYSYPKIVLYSMAAVAFLWYANQPSRRRLAGLAGLVAVAALVRHDHGLYIGIASVAAVVLSPIPSDRRKGVLSVALLAAMVFVFMLPYFIYLQTIDGIVAHIQRGMAYAALEVPRQRLTINGLPLYDAWMLAAAWLAPTAALAVIAFRVLSRRDGAWSTARRVAPVAALALVANAGLIRDSLDVRLPDAIVAPALLMAWLVHQTWRPGPSPLWLAARIAAVAVLLMTMRYAMEMGAFPEQLDRANLLSGLDRVPERVTTLLREMERPWAGRQVPSAVAGEMRPFFDYAERCIPTDNRLLVAAFLPEVAVLAQRPFAGGQIVFMPGALTTQADHERVMRRLDGQRVPVAVFRRPAYDELAMEFPELDAYIRGRFTEVAHWSLGDDDAVHLLMDAKQSTGTDAKTGWPCFT